MKLLAVTKTVLPTGEEIYWNRGMPSHKYYAMDSQLFNRWAKYIHDQNSKAKGWQMNKVRVGGIGYKDKQEQVLKMAKDILWK
jgi:hypothetical protein